MAERDVGPSDEPERPVRELLADLRKNTETLVREELRLARSEVESRIAEARTDLMKSALGAAVLYAGTLALFAALVLFVAKFVAPWVAALLVGVATVGLGYALVRSGKGAGGRKLKPERTIAALRQDMRALKGAVK